MWSSSKASFFGRVSVSAECVSPECTGSHPNTEVKRAGSWLKPGGVGLPLFILSKTTKQNTLCLLPRVEVDSGNTNSLEIRSLSMNHVGSFEINGCIVLLDPSSINGMMVPALEPHHYFLSIFDLT